MMSHSDIYSYPDEDILINHFDCHDKKKLSKLILLETLISSLTAGVIAFLTGLLLTSLLETTLNGLDLGIDPLP